MLFFSHLPKFVLLKEEECIQCLLQMVYSGCSTSIW